MHFQRPDVARELAKHLLSPALLRCNDRQAGLFLTGPARTGKSTFLATDLALALEGHGAASVYINLERLAAGGRPAYTEPTSAHQAVITARVAAMLGRRTDAGGAALVEAVNMAIHSAGLDVVLIIDAIDGAPVKGRGSALLGALRDAAEAVNNGPASPRRLLLLGCGRDGDGLRTQLADRAHPLAGAHVFSLPVLGPDFVEFALQRAGGPIAQTRPSLQAGIEAFARLAHRPGELFRALALLRLVPEVEADTALLTTANALRCGIAERELSRLFDMGALPLAIFDRLASGNPAPFSGAAKTAYQAAAGRRPSTSEVQSAMNALVGANYVSKSGRRTYICADATVQQLWQERQRLQNWNLA